MKHIEVVAAVIIKDGKCLCTKRNINNYKYISYKYEYPGCKVALGETVEESLSREMFEALSVEIKVHELCKTVEHRYPDFKVTLHVYFCELVSGDIQLQEHIDYKWLMASDLDQVDWAEANRAIVDVLMAV